MLLPALVALSLVTAQVDDDPWAAEDGPDEAADTGPFVIAWGGSAFELNGGPSHGVVGGEAGWSFQSLDLGVAGYGVKGLDESKDRYDPVVLLRLGQRFQTYRGLEGSLAFGIGAADTGKWRSWVQLALGVRLRIDPLFVAGEITFEQNGLVRLSGGLGARF